MTADLLSVPKATLSLDSSKSIIVTTFLFFLAASKADSLTRLARSAPEKPGVPLATVLMFTSGAYEIFFI